ncbi:MAG: ACT domain-containing protein [Thermodesulfovibrionales bacterium]|nr:ACT domain-containing protein [Thermodesulfovibrionales bacterium]
MSVEQISVFVENRSGRLAEVSQVLANADINIRALYLAEAGDFGILRLIVNKTDLALEVLKDSGFTVSKTEVIAVAIPDKPGGLAKVLQIIRNKEINVEYMYAFIEKSTENAIVVFRFDELQKAIDVLKDEGVRILSGEEVYSL